MEGLRGTMVGLRWGDDPRPIQRAGCPPWPDEQETHPAALAIGSGKIVGGIEAKHDWNEELTTAETIRRLVLLRLSAVTISDGFYVPDV